MYHYHVSLTEGGTRIYSVYINIENNNDDENDIRIKTING